LLICCSSNTIKHMAILRDIEHSEQLEGIRARESALRDRFIKEAKVTNFEKGYVSVKWVNQLVDLGYQGFAADLIAYRFRGYEFDKVVGIPNSGIPLATSVAERLGLPLAPGRKGKDIPGAWETPVIVKEKVKSFTTDDISEFVFNGLEKGDRVLLVDDVIAHSTTASLIIDVLRQEDIEIEMAVYFTKLFQHGVDKLRSNQNIDPFYVIGVSEMQSDKSVLLSPPRF